MEDIAKNPVINFVDQVPIKCTQDLFERGICPNLNQDFVYYNPSRMASETSMPEKISQLAVARLCAVSKNNFGTGIFLEAIEDDGFELVNNSTGKYPCPLNPPAGSPKISFSVEAEIRNSVKVEIDSPGSISLGTANSVQYNANFPFGS